MRTQAVLLDKDLTITFGVRELPDPLPGEVVVDVEWSGICGSDLHVLQTGAWVSYWPATLGHEVAGRVAHSDVPAFPAGCKVVIDSRMPTGLVNGQLTTDRLSPDLQWFGEARPGGFARTTVAPAASLSRVDDSLELSDAVLAEPLAVVMCALDEVRSVPATVLVLGHGPIGALAHAEVRTRWPDAEVSVVEPMERRRALASSMGARLVHSPQREQFDLVLDAAGYRTSLPDAVDFAARGGGVVLIALGHTPVEVSPAQIVEKSLSISGNVGFDDRHLDKAVDRLQKSPERYRDVVTHHVNLADLPEFLARQGQAEAIKVLVRCNA